MRIKSVFGQKCSNIWGLDQHKRDKGQKCWLYIDNKKPFNNIVLKLKNSLSEQVKQLHWVKTVWVYNRQRKNAYMFLIYLLNQL